MGTALRALLGEADEVAPPAKTRVAWKRDAFTVRMMYGDELVGVLRARLDTFGLKKCQSDIDALKARGYSGTSFGTSTTSRSRNRTEARA